MRGLKTLELLPFLFILVSGFWNEPSPSIQEWPQWRGPARDGAASSGSRTWPENLVRSWSVQVGSGLSSPVIAGDRVFVHSREDDQEVVRALDRRSGTELWKDVYGAPYAVRPEASAHGKGPRATPIVDGERLFTFGVSGVLSSYDVTNGNVRWRKDTSGEFDHRSLRYGASTSPLVERGLLVAHAGHETAGGVFAYAVATGAERWRWLGEAPSYSSPMVAELSGVRQIVTISSTSMVGLSIESGSPLWQLPYARVKYPHTMSPVVFGDMVFMSGAALGTTAFRVTLANGTWTTHPAWHNEQTSMTLSTPVFHSGYLYGLSDRNRGQFVCLDARTGETKWASDGRQGEIASIIRVGDAMLFMKGDGEVIVASANPKAFEILRRYRLTESMSWSTPAFGNGLVIVRDGEKLTAWSAGTEGH